MGAVERADYLTVMGADGFAYEMEAAVCCWAGEGAVEVGELAGPNSP